MKFSRVFYSPEYDKILIETFTKKGDVCYLIKMGEKVIKSKGVFGYWHFFKKGLVLIGRM